MEINVRDARQKLSELLDRVQSGEDIVLLRHGKASAVMTRPVRQPRELPSMEAFRDSLGSAADQSSSELIREDRDDR